MVAVDIVALDILVGDLFHLLRLFFGRRLFVGHNLHTFDASLFIGQG